MAIWRKTKIYGLAFILIIGFCFPPGGMNKVEAAKDKGFIVKVDKISGRINLLGLRPGIIFDTQVAFTSARGYGFSLSKLIETKQGTLAMTIKSSSPSKRVDVSWLTVTAHSLNIGGLCWPERLLDVCLTNVIIDGKKLESSGTSFPDMVLETSYNPIEVSKVQALYNKLENQNDEEQLEKLILAIDKAEGGKFTQQKEAYEDLKAQLPELEKQADGFQTLLEEAEAQKKQLEAGMTSLEEVMDKADQLTKKPEFEEMLKGIDGKQKEITTNIEDFSVTLEQVEDLLQKVQKSLEKKQEFVKARFELLEELELGEWSNSYKELEEIKQKLDTVEEKVTAGFKRLEKLKENEQQLTDRMKKINEKIEALKNKEIKEEEEKQEEQAGEDTEDEETESDQKEKESDDEKLGEKDPEDSSQTDDLEAFTSSVNELFTQVDETNKNFSILGSKLEEDFIEPVQKALNNQLDDDEVTKLQQTLDESLKNKTMNNKLTKFVEIKEKMGDYKARLAEQADELKQLKNHVEDVNQKELLEIQDKIKKSDTTLKEMQGRMEEIETHLDDLFKDSKQKQQELDENTNEPLLGILEDLLKVEALLKEMKG
ncbi:hypothetical protein DCC39_02570 [Pueribacillus theae]|uniref:Uncharacterized protein n=1 Tax=Pueribacillus theae TaxID=2171751 RepID=A0A2U1K7R6_9BACI|nr:hypothetical protein [Pueribacillus theae]PWA13033.1 hypothetical protein DCC39_02570 [Pueribacillus theae]